MIINQLDLLIFIGTTLTQRLVEKVSREGSIIRHTGRLMELSQIQRQELQALGILSFTLAFSQVQIQLLESLQN